MLEILVITLSIRNKGKVESNYFLSQAIEFTCLADKHVKEKREK